MVLATKKIGVLDVTRSYRQRLLISGLLILTIFAILCFFVLLWMVNKKKQLRPIRPNQATRKWAAVKVSFSIFIMTIAILFVLLWAQKGPLSAYQTKQRSQSLPNRESRMAGSGFSLQAINSTHDFGIIKSWRNVTCEFEMKNVSGREVAINKVRAPCSCIASKPSKARLAPGETTKISVNFDPRGMVGPFRKSIYVELDAPLRQIVALAVEGTIERPYSMKPTQISFGKLILGEESFKKAVIHCSNSDEVSRIRVVSPKSYLQCSTVRIGQDWEITVKLSGSIPIGRLCEYVDVIIEGQNSSEETLTFPVVGNIKPLVEVKPRIVYFDLSARPVQRVIENKVELRWNRPGLFNITSINAIDGIEVNWAKSVGKKGYDLLAVLQDEMKVKKADHKKIVLQLDVPEQTEIKLPVVVVP